MQFEQCKVSSKKDLPKVSFMNYITSSVVALKSVREMIIFKQIPMSLGSNPHQVVDKTITWRIERCKPPFTFFDIPIRAMLRKIR